MKVTQFWMKMRCRFGKHIPKTCFKPTDNENIIIYSRECAVCDKILYGPHEVSIELIDLINELSTVVLNT